jgi:hypothetical protein
VNEQETYPLSELPASLRQAYLLAGFSLLVLMIYAAAQAGVALVIAPRQEGLKLVLEPYLLLLGLILHVQWRRVGAAFLGEGLRRPLWIIAADCLSFVITFWALAVIVMALWN